MPSNRHWALIAVLFCACDHVEHSEKSTPVGPLSLHETCTIRRSSMPDMPDDTHCTSDLLGADGGPLRKGVHTATIDPLSQRVVATAASGRHAWLYEAKTGTLLSEQDLPDEDAYPTWSPDGTAIVTSRAFAHGLYVTEIPFRGASANVDARYAGSGFAWSTDGAKLGYVLSAENHGGGRGTAQLWVWDRASSKTAFVVQHTFVSWAQFTAWVGWVGSEPHLCSDNFADPDTACAGVSRPR